LSFLARISAPSSAIRIRIEVASNGTSTVEKGPWTTRGGNPAFETARCHWQSKHPRASAKGMRGSPGAGKSPSASPRLWRTAPVVRSSTPAFNKHDHKRRTAHDRTRVDDDLHGCDKFAPKQQIKHSKRHHYQDQRERAVNRFPGNDQKHGPSTARKAQMKNRRNGTVIHASANKEGSSQSL